MLVDGEVLSDRTQVAQPAIPTLLLNPTLSLHRMHFSVASFPVFVKTYLYSVSQTLHMPPETVLQMCEPGHSVWL